jgi:RNA polymerase sigma factor (sigma-70 family)
MGVRDESMPTSPLSTALRDLLADLGPDGGGATDGELLARFQASRDEAALAALVQRHAPMVWGVCRRQLQNHHDAEDAFQATFLVLVKKAAGVPAQAVAGWLYGVARQTAVRLRALAARRARRERQVVSMPEPTEEVRDAGLASVLDEELGRLPGHYRGIIILCDLEGLTRKEAARQLGLPEGTVASRLARARVLLARRLARQGLAVSGPTLAGVLAQQAARASVPASGLTSLIESVTLVAAGQAVAGVVSLEVAALTERVLKAMSLNRLLKVTVVLLVVAALGGAAGLLYEVQAGHSHQDRVAARQADEKRVEGALPPRQDRLGDPLPPGAVARMGSSRFRHLTHMAYLGVIVSPDSKTLLTTSEYGVRAWSLTTGKLLYHLRDEFDFHPVFSPDGKQLAMIANGTIYLRDAATARKLRRIPATGEFPKRPVLLTFSADGRRLAAALHEGDILILDSATGKQIGSLDVRRTGKVSADYFLVFAADGRTLLSMGRDPEFRDVICHWDLATYKLLKRVVPAYTGSRSTVALSPDGRTLAVPSRGPVTLLDTQTGLLRCTLQGDRNRATYGLAFSPDGKTLATAWTESGEPDATASLWDTATGKLRRRFRVPLAATTHLHFSSDGRLLLIPGGCLVRFWDIATGKEVLQQPAHTYSVRSLAFTPDGRSIVSGGGETIRVWDARTGQQRQVIVAHRWHVNQLKVRADGRTVVSCGADGTVRVHDITSGKELRRCLVDRQPETLRELGPQVVRLGLAPDGRTAASFCSPFDRKGAQVHVWDLESGRALFCRPSSDEGYTGSFSPDARLLLTPRQWYDSAGEKTARMGGPPKDGQKRKARPLEKDGAPAGPLRTAIVVREVATDRELLTLPQPDVFGNVMALTPDGQCLLTTTYTPAPDNRSDNRGPSTLRLWELASGKQRLTIISDRRGDQHAFTRLAVARDGRTLATVRQDQTMQFWDLATGKELLRVPGHYAPVDSLSFSPDGQRLATGHQDSTILIWDIAAACKRRAHPRRAEARELETWWRHLAGDAPEAHRAIWGLAGVPTQAVPLLGGRLRPVAALPADELQRLVQDLDSADFRRREEASRRLSQFGEDAEPTLRQALANKPSAEVRRRLQRLLNGPRPVPSSDLLRCLRALQVLEAIGDQPARRLLGKLAAGAPSSRLTREARAALERLSER